MDRPFVDSGLGGAGALGGGSVGGSRLVGRGAIIGFGAGERGLRPAIELLLPRCVLLPVARLDLLDDEQQREAQRDGEPGDALRAQQAQRHHCSSASMIAPSRPALSLNRPTGPPASRPTMTAIIAAIRPPSDQPKMVTMVCSSSRD